MPQIILIPADHPNRRLKALPHILRNSFPTKVIAYSESNSPSSGALIHEMGAEFTILPPCSGPSIERLLYKILKEWTMEDFDSSNLRVSSGALEALGAVLGGGAGSERTLGQNTIPSALQHVRGATAANQSSSIQSNRLIDETVEAESIPANELKKAFEISIISRGTQLVLNQTCEADEAIKQGKRRAQKIQRTSNAYCLVINSERFKGYMVAALGPNKILDENFILEIQQKLWMFLRKHGENIQNHLPLKIRIKEVDFEPWAAAQAEFLKRSIHGPDEFAIAFFPAEDAGSFVGSGGEEKMLAISIDELEADTEVAFDLYLYLPENRRYILYTPQHSKLLKAQKDRLKDRGILKMHFRVEAINQANVHKAERHLNQNISQFIEKQTRRNP